MDVQIDDIKPVENVRRALTVKQPRTDKGREIIQLKQANPKLTGADIGRITGTSKQNVSAVLKRYNIDNKQLSSYKQFQADILSGLSNNILSTIDHDIINKASLKDRVLSSAILIDKSRTIEGKSNVNIALSKVVELIDKSDM